MKTFEDCVESAHIAELKNQNASLLALVLELQDHVRQFPSMLSSARIAAKEGKQTVYDYRTHAAVLRTP